MAKKLPKKPKANKQYGLTEEEENCLNYYCAFQCSKVDAVKIFLHPEIISKLQIKSITDQFFAMDEVQSYIKDYEETLQEFFEEKKKPKAELSEKDREARKRKALESIADKVIELAQNLDDEGADPESIIKYVDKLGWLDNEEVKVEQPRRYLPETCHSSCRYRAFCEQECEDLCQYCKYRKYAEENGVHYDNEKQLDMPLDSGEDNNEPKGNNK
jgi:arsenate reductase-like glutaredoxin family protein